MYISKHYRTTMRLSQAVILLAVMTIISCKSGTDDPDPMVNTLTLMVDYNVDGAPLEFDTVKYYNAANNKYSVTRLQYYISDIVFIKTNDEEVSTNGVYYFDAREPAKNSIKLTGIPKGTYKGMRFFVGLPPELNVKDGLPGTKDNVNMIWPDMMGGGYHFIKLEGHFTNGGQVAGYAVHLGTDTALVSTELQASYVVGNFSNIVLDMDINEWFENPNEYDLSDGNYTMGNIAAMRKIAANGQNVFSIKND